MLNTTKSLETHINSIELMVRERNAAHVPHSYYESLGTLLRNLAHTLNVDRHWPEHNEKRNDPGYITETFQRIILQFILDNSGAEFMRRQVVQQPRQVEEFLEGQSLRSPSIYKELEELEEMRKRSSSQCLTPQSRVKRLHLDVTSDTNTEVSGLHASLDFILFSLTS